ncbi:MAG: DUF2849 domain-containing protein [Alphaproteobacteria bacterium]
MSDSDDATFKVITANRLGDGIIVYFSAASGWQESINDATVASGDEVDALLERAEQGVDANQVVDVYAVEITGAHEPLSARERIRASGPSIRFGDDALPTNNSDFEI